MERKRYLGSIELWHWRTLPTPVETSVVLRTVKPRSWIREQWHENNKIPRNSQHRDWDPEQCTRQGTGILMRNWGCGDWENIRSCHLAEKVMMRLKTCKVKKGHWDMCFGNLIWFLWCLKLILLICPTTPLCFVCSLSCVVHFESVERTGAVVWLQTQGGAKEVGSRRYVKKPGRRNATQPRRSPE